MEITYLTGEDEIPKNEPQVMAIGFFDGVHLGHQRLFETTKMKAKELNTKSSILTFNPHPDEVIKGDVKRKYLTPIHEKINKIQSSGIDQLFVMKFDLVFASLSPFDFINRYLTGMNVSHVVVGFDFTFGYKAQGNLETLKKAALQRRFGITVLPKVTCFDTKIGSTETKYLIRQGNVAFVPLFLGCYYEVEGFSVYLDSLQNKYHLQINQSYLLPVAGTYLVKVTTATTKFDAELMIDGRGHCTLSQVNKFISLNQMLRIAFINKVIIKEDVFV